MEKEILEITSYFDSMGLEIATVIVALCFGLLAIKLILILTKRLFLISSIDNALVSFFQTSINVVLKIALLLFCLKTLEIPLTSMIAILSAVGVAIGLAIQDSIANVANGIVMIGTRPFKVGDFVEIGDDAGTISELRLMNTVLTTRDNRTLILPNKLVFNSRILNYHTNKLRKVNTVFNVDYDTDLDSAIKIVEKAARGCTLIKKEPSPEAFLKTAGAHSLDIDLWYWCDSNSFINANYQVQKAVYDAFKANDIEIPFEQLTISERPKKPSARKTTAVKKTDTAVKKAEAPNEEKHEDRKTVDEKDEKKTTVRKATSRAAQPKTDVKKITATKGGTR